MAEKTKTPPPAIPSPASIERNRLADLERLARINNHNTQVLDEKLEQIEQRSRARWRDCSLGIGFVLLAVLALAMIVARLLNQKEGR